MERGRGSMKRYAIVKASPNGQYADTIARYLPANYSVIGEGPDGVLIAGEDKHGWTLDDYVIPRLASGLYFAQEIPMEATHPECPKCSYQHDPWDGC